MSLDVFDSEVSETLGYRDIYFFNRQFKQFFDLSPTEYRQQSAVLPLVRNEPTGP
ncbi:MAG: AraC family transcriptional regulator [Opitutales bacterium]